MSLTAAAMRTERIRLGTDSDALFAYAPVKLASETATLDHLSNGRVILAVGLGAIDTGFAAFGEETDRKMRAELLDEGLIFYRPVARAAVQLQRQALSVKETDVLPAAAAGAAAAHPDLGGRRLAAHRNRCGACLRYDGLLPMVIGDGGDRRETTPDDIRAMKAFVEANRAGPAPFDIIVEGETPALTPRSGRRDRSAWADAGATWRIEGALAICRTNPAGQRLFGNVSIRGAAPVTR